MAANLAREAASSLLSGAEIKEDWGNSRTSRSGVFTLQENSPVGDPG
jgi:hypothetical protein